MGKGRRVFLVDVTGLTELRTFGDQTEKRPRRIERKGSTLNNPNNFENMSSVGRIKLMEGISVQWVYNFSGSKCSTFLAQSLSLILKAVEVWGEKKVLSLGLAFSCERAIYLGIQRK